MTAVAMLQVVYPKSPEDCDHPADARSPSTLCVSDSSGRELSTHMTVTCFDCGTCLYDGHPDGYDGPLPDYTKGL